MLYVMVVKNQSNSRPINLNINNLGFKAVYRLGSDGGLSHGYTANWLRNGNPYIIMYSYGYWRIINYPRSAAEDLIGTVPISKGGHGGATAAEARANLEITPENIGALPNTTVIPAIDSTLSISGQAADAKAVGEAIAASLLTDESIDALIALII